METLTIASLAAQVRGVSYKPEDLHGSLDDSSVILLRANNIDDGEINFDDVVFVDKKRVSNEQFLRKGDILVCASSGSKNLVGKAASVDFDKEVTFGAFCKVVRPCNIEDAEYLAMFFQSPIYRRQIAATAIGANINNIRNEHIDTISVKWPATVKRKEIVDILSKAESIIRKRKKQLSALDDLIKARFVEMFEGKDYPTLAWNDVFNTTTGKLDSNAMVEDGAYPFFTCAKEVLRIDKYAFDQEALLLAGNNAAGKYDVKYYKGKFNAYQRTYVLGLKQEWSYRLFQYQLEDKLDFLQQQSLGGLTKYLTLKILGALDFIVPPMKFQEEFETFVTQVDKFKSVIQKFAFRRRHPFPNLEDSKRLDGNTSFINCWLR